LENIESRDVVISKPRERPNPAIRALKDLVATLRHFRGGKLGGNTVDPIADVLDDSVRRWTADSD